MSLITWLRKAVTSEHGTFDANCRARAPRRFFTSLCLEMLEDRLAPVTNLWMGGNADWSIVADWSQGHTPVAGEDVQITNGATVTHSGNSTAGGDVLNSLTISGGSSLVLSGGSITDSTILDASMGGSQFTLSGGILSGATVVAGTTITGTTSGGTLDGVTLDGILDLSSNYGVKASVTGGLTLGSGSVVDIGNSSGNYGILSFNGGNQTLAGSGSVLFGSSGYDLLQAGPSDGSALTIGPDILIHGQNGTIGYSNIFGGSTNVTFTNQGTIDADVAAGSLTLNGSGWSNTGTIAALNDGNATLLGSWTNSGSISVAAGSTLNLGGTFATATLGSITSAGTVNVTGTLTNTASTLSLNNLTGSWQLLGGTIDGGTLATTGSASLIATTSGGTLANGVTLDGILDLSSNYGVKASVTGGLTLGSGSVVDIGNSTGNYGVLSFNGGSQTLAGSGSVLFGSSGYDLLQAGPSDGSALTIGPNIFVHGQNGTIGYSNIFGGSTNVTFTNQGTLDADVAAGSLTLNGSGWTNTGTIAALNDGNATLLGSWTNSGSISVAAGSTLNLGGTFATATLGSITSAGTVNVTGTLTNSASTLSLNNITGSWQLLGGTIDGGTLATTGSASLIATTSGGTLANGVTLDGILDLSSNYGVKASVTGGLTLGSGIVVDIGSSSGNYGILSFNGGNQTLAGSGSVLFGSSGYDLLQAGPSAGSALTIGPDILIHGQNGTIGYSNIFGGSTNVTFTNQGTLDADVAAGSLTLNGSGWTNTGTIAALNDGNATLLGSWTNSGSISVAAGSTLNLGGTFATATLGSITSAGTVNVTGTLTNSASTLTLNNITGSWQLLGGTIDGGTLATTGSASLIATTSGGMLANGVTLDGILDLSSNYGVKASVTGGLTLAAGSVVDIGSSSGNYGILSFNGGSQTLAGSGSVLFGSSGYNFLQAGPSAGSALTIGPDILIHGQNGTIGYSNIFGGSTNVTFTNQGTIDADAAGGTITAMNDTNFSGGTLTGGTWQVSANSTVRLLGANITTNAASIILDGVNSNIFSDTGSTDALAGLLTNAAAGSFTFQNGRNFAPAGAFINSGNMTIGNGSMLSISAGVTNSGTLALSSAEVNDNGLITNAGTLDLTDSTLNVALANQGLLVAQGISAINSATSGLTTTASSAIRVQGNNGPGGGNNAGNALLTIANGFTNIGTIELTTAGADPSRSATLDVTSGSLTNTGNINSLAGVGFNAGSGRTLDAELINQGTVLVSMPLTLSEANAAQLNSDRGIIDVMNGDLTVLQSGITPMFTNNGTINISAGHTFTISGGALTNFDIGTSTLSGGTYNIAGTFQFAGANIVTNAANITLIGSPPGIEDLSSNNALANLATNTGSLSLTSGTLVSTAGDFSNQGAVTIDATTGATASQLFVNGNYNQSGTGSTTLVAGGILAVGDATKSVNLQSGTVLQGTGTVNGNVANSGALDPGTSTTVGIIAITGSYTQNAGATLNIKLAGNSTPGTDYDEITVTGTATLDGTIHMQAINGFQPASGDSYRVMTFASSSGDFSSKTGISFSNAFLVEEFATGSLFLAAFANPVVVNNTSDVHVNGETSLREAIDAANTGSRLGVAVTITFAASLSGTTITLTQGVLELGQDGSGSGTITIDGSSLASPITISGNFADRVFQIDAGVQASLTSLVIVDGFSSFTGGGILNEGTLTLTGDVLMNNGSNDTGGAIGSIGTLIVDSSVLLHNSAFRAGGAILSGSGIIVTGSTFTSNRIVSPNGTGGGAIAIFGGNASITLSNFVSNSVSTVAAAGADNAGGAIYTAVPGTTIEFDRFSGNSDATPSHGNTVGLASHVGANLDDNWWDSNAGPGVNDVVSGSGNSFSPRAVNDFLVVSESASPNPILVGTHSTVTTGFTTDSAGNSISPANLGALADLTASFAGNTLSGSSLTGASATIQNGQAAATYNAGASGGIDTVTATVDGVTVSTNLTVEQPPSISSANHDTFTVGTPGTFTMTTASFPTASLSESGALPSGVHFHDNGDGTATLSGTPDVGAGNSYTLTITASNGVSPDFQQTFTLTVNEAISFTSARTATFLVNVDTPFKVMTSGFPIPTLTASEPIPTGVGFVDNGDGTGTLSGNAVPDTGAYVFTITAHNGVAADATQTFTLTLIDPPTFINTATSATYSVGHPITPFVIATSPGLPLTTTLTETGTLPNGLKFSPGTKGTATITGTPKPGSGGTYTITLTASSGVFQSTQVFTLTVNEPGVQAPTFGSFLATPFLVGQQQSLAITTSPGTPTTTTVTDKGKLPAGLIFVPGRNGTATITGKPAANTGGQFPITLIASNGLRQTTQTYTLTVDQPPAITSPASGTLALGQNGSIVIKTSGFPAPQVTTSDILPSGVQLLDVGGVWMLTGTPTGSTSTTTVHLVADNDIVPNFTQTFMLKVAQAPTFNLSGDSTTFIVGTAQAAIAISTTAGLPTTTTVTEKGALPLGLKFVPGPHGTASITGIAKPGSGGVYPITLIASNGVAQTTQTYTLTVEQPPAVIGSTSISFIVGEVGLFAVKTTGFPHPGLQLGTGSLPPGVQFSDNGDGTGELTGVPAAGSAGPYTFQIIASAMINDVLVTAPPKNYTLIVNQAPIFVPVNMATFTTNVSGSFTIQTNPATKPTAKLTETGTLPSGVHFVDNHDGTATLKGTPAKSSHGTTSYVLVITASDGVLPAALQELTLTVN